ncbi:unnamed protein product [Mytilus coruscus]|uniref:Uncharacterized protein n=1 Tax=Mytilus coruscus TaxID=42192 RepID=A0A6J8D229_MYTCO|nr:unnamed protein product [Mytilus coruscus]
MSVTLVEDIKCFLSNEKLKRNDQSRASVEVLAASVSGPAVGNCRDKVDLKEKIKYHKKEIIEQTLRNQRRWREKIKKLRVPVHFSEFGISSEVKIEAEGSNVQDETFEDDRYEIVADMINTDTMFSVLCDDEENDFFFLKATSESRTFYRRRKSGGRLFHLSSLDIISKKSLENQKRLKLRLV